MSDGTFVNAAVVNENENDTSGVGWYQKVTSSKCVSDGGGGEKLALGTF